MHRNPTAARPSVERDEAGGVSPALRIVAEDIYTAVDREPSVPARAILIALPLAAILWAGIALLLS